MTANDEYTAPAAVWKHFALFWCLRSGWNEGRSIQPKYHAEFPGIIMEINGLRRVATDP
jgi:hypothetical protein